MIRVAVISPDDEFHRALRVEALAGSVRIELRRRVFDQPLPVRTLDAVIVHEPSEDELEAVLYHSEGLPIVLVSDADFNPDWHRGQDGWAHLPGESIRAILAATHAATHGMAVVPVADAGDPGLSEPAPPGLPGRAQRPAADLSERELEVLRLLGSGMTNKEVAEGLGISQNTVKYHVSGIYSKLDVGRRPEMVFEAIRRGLISI